MTEREIIKTVVKTVIKNALDHGMLNVPLGSRARGGGIDSQIDKYKKETAEQKRRQEKQRATETRSDKEEARAYQQYINLLAGSTANKHNLNKRDVVNKLDSMMKWEPRKFIDLMKKFKSERGL